MIPCVQRVQKLSLVTMTLLIDSSKSVAISQGSPIPKVYTAQGVPICVTGVAQVKINGKNDEMLRHAAEHFGGKTMDEIKSVVLETLEGHQRAIMGTMTVEEIYKDQKMFSRRVFEVASTDLAGMGFIIVSYTIKAVCDEEGYLKALGLGRTAQVQRDAAIGKAEAQMDTQIKQALAKEELMKSQLANDVEVLRAKRDFDVKKASYDVEVNTAKAEAELAFQLQALFMQQKIMEEKQEAELVERKKRIEISELEIQRNLMKLDYSVKKPAEAEKFRLEKIAEAENKRKIIEAQAEAEAIILKGEAEAFAIEEKAKAEAEQMAKKAEAWNNYQNAAKVEMILAAIPKLAAEVARPLMEAQKIRMVSDDGCESIGASRLTNEIFNIMKSVPDIVTSMTGVKLNDQL